MTLPVNAIARMYEHFDVLERVKHLHIPGGQ